MSQSVSHQRFEIAYSTHHKQVDAQIAQLLKDVADPFDRRLLIEMVVSVYRLGEKRSSTGDLKILNTALKELRYAFEIFRPYRHVRKVALFGSARISSRHSAYREAKAFGRLMNGAGWMVITGAASGIMRAGHEGAGSDRSFGLNIRLPFEQKANVVIAQDPKLINCKYFFTRKLLFIKESHATVLFPGGFGTLDEGFESLTLVQTGKSDPRPIVFVESPDRPFWRPLLRFFEQKLVREGMISPSEKGIYQVARSAQEAVDKVRQFYHVYHSMRSVGSVLAMRLSHRLSDASVEDLNLRFRDLLASGTIRQAGALREEGDEPELEGLTRLLLRFDRKSYGRLIQMIHRINSYASGS